jgi:cell division initiation protein
MMLTAEDFKNISFRKGRGYRSEDVDTFIDEVVSFFETMQKENSELISKIGILTKEVQNYQKDEDAVKSALIKSQRIADKTIKEAECRASVIVKNAQIEARQKVSDEQRAYDDLKNKVYEFRMKLLTIYKEHLQFIDAIPSGDESYNSKEDSESSVSDNNNININKIEENEKDESTVTYPEPTHARTIKLESNSISSETTNRYSVARSSKFKDLQFGDEYKISSLDGHSRLV